MRSASSSTKTLDVVQAKRIAPHEIEQAARCRDQDVHAIEKRANLGAHRYAADRECGPDAQMPSVSAEAVEDLAGQFARRAQHQDAARSCVQPAGRGSKTMQDRKCESGGLAGAGLGDADHVAVPTSPIGIVCAWIGVGVTILLFLPAHRVIAPLRLKSGKVGQLYMLSVVLRHSRCVETPRPALRGNTRHPARSGLSMKRGKVASQKPFDGLNR